jgi:hypothetical protein
MQDAAVPEIHRARAARQDSMRDLELLLVFRPVQPFAFADQGQVVRICRTSRKSGLMNMLRFGGCFRRISGNTQGGSQHCGTPRIIRFAAIR